MFPIKTIQDLESLSQSMKWQWFEKLVAWIFGQNGFEAKTGVVETAKGKRQYDVVAKKFDTIFLVECKKRKKSSASAIKKAVEDHMERCLIYKTLHKEKEVIPVLVTLLEEDIRIHNGIPIVPIGKLNQFLNSWENSPVTPLR